MSEYMLAKEAAAARVLKAALAEFADDPDTIADMIEGETNLHEAIALVEAGIREDETLLIGVQGMIRVLGARKSRIEARSDRRRIAIERAMAAAEITKVELPAATLSLRRVPPALHVVSETLIPDKFWEPQPPRLNRREVTDALKSGQEVPGATLDNGSTTLAVRRA